MNEVKEYTLCLFSENQKGILNRVSIIFSRRGYNIKSITASLSEFEEVYRYTIIVDLTESQVKKLIGQLEKQIDVLRAFYYEEKETVYQEIALYKIRTKRFFQNEWIEKLLHKNQLKVLSVGEEVTVLEKTGKEDEIIEVYEMLRPLGVLEFARSGRVSISKPLEDLSSQLFPQH